MQVEGKDFQHTYTSTSIPPTQRVILALAASNNWEIEQIDFIGAFLNSELSETIYMDIPDGFLEFTESLLTDSKLWSNIQRQRLLTLLKEAGFNPSIKQAILLKKALYGLKQAPRKWQHRLKDLISSEGFLPLASDAAVFYNKQTSTFIVTYVDDCLLVGPNITYINQLKRKFHKVYAIEDRGPASFFLGVQIIRNRKEGLLWLHQAQFIAEVLAKFGLQDTKLQLIPLQPGILNESSGKDLSPTDQSLYQSLTGTIMWLMMITRPDLAFPTQQIGRAHV